MSLLRSEGGFTLAEVLVVITIIGILAAVGVPTLLDQRAKGQDTTAKSNARNALAEVEWCFVTRQDYRECTTPDVLAGSGIPTSGSLAVTVTATQNTYRVAARSRSQGGAQSFNIEREAAGDITRTCGTAGSGGCAPESDPDGNSW